MYKELKQFFKRSRCIVTLARSIQFGVQDCRRVTWCLVRSRAIESYLRSYQIRKLQIGAGPNIMKGWLNTDVYPTSPEVVFLDATKPFPFLDCIFDYVFSEHLIEHLTYDEGLFMLRESYRVLKPGCRIRIATISLEALLSLYKAGKSGLQQKYIKWFIDRYLPEIGEYRESFVINSVFREFGHQFLYDRPTLQSVMEEAGFIDFNSYTPGESADESLRGIESHGKVVGNEEMNQFETMVMEAKRPFQNWVIQG